MRGVVNQRINDTSHSIHNLCKTFFKEYFYLDSHKSFLIVEE